MMITFIPYSDDDRSGPEHASVELVRQWIRDNWEDGVCANITRYANERPQYHRDIGSTGLFNDGFVTLADSNLTIWWNPNTGEYSDSLNIKTFYMLFFGLIGAGFSAQVWSLEMRLLTPSFESLSSTHTVIHSFYDKPTILPYELLGDLEDASSPELDHGRRSFVWKVGPITFVKNGPYGVLDIRWFGGSKSYLGAFSEIMIHYERYKHGIVLHITAMSTYPIHDHRFATIMIINH